MLSRFLKIKLFVLIHVIKWLRGYNNVETLLIYSQALHETGNFTSKIFKENKNLFGMREAKIRKSYAIGSGSGHAIYKSHLDSILDYFERQRNFKISSSNNAEFIRNTVSSGYATDTSYQEKWENIFLKAKSPIPFWFKWVLLGLVLLILLTFIRKENEVFN